MIALACLLAAHGPQSNSLAGQASSTSPASARVAEPAPPKPGFLILAPASFGSALKPLVDARSREFAVEFAALEDVVAGDEGVDPPERIKRHLYRAWKERDARYALLVGDADTFPVRFMVLDRVTAPAFDYAFYPCDLYYADLADEGGAFDDWNADKEGFHARYFGEVRGEKNKDGPIDHDHVSYVPEIAVGRWPVSSTAEAAVLVAKTLAFEARSPHPRALLVHADGWIDARDRVNRLAESLTQSDFDVTRQIYGTDRAVPSPKSVLDALLRGTELAVHVGHGSDETWHACLGPAEREKLSDAHPTLFVSVGCSTAHFCCEPPYQAYVDEQGIPHRGTNAGEVFPAPPPAPSWYQPGECNGTGLGERLVKMPKGGAIAYIGCDTGAQPCAVTLLEGFVEGLCAANSTRRIGDAWREALAFYWKRERLSELKPDPDWYPPSIYFQGMKFVLFGDPTLRLSGPGLRDSDSGH